MTSVRSVVTNNSVVSKKNISKKACMQSRRVHTKTLCILIAGDAVLQVK